MNRHALPFALLSLAAFVSCSSQKEPSDPGSAPADASGGSSASTARPETPDAAKPAAPLRELVFPDIEGWTREAGSGGMRAAQYTLPKAEGEADAATVVVYVFPGGVGGFQANFDRWCSQMQQPDGKPTKDVAVMSQTSVAGHPAQMVELPGTYAAADMGGGMGGGAPKPDWTMLQTYLEGEGKTWTIRLLGPRAAVERAKADYRRFLGAIRSAG